MKKKTYFSPEATVEEMDLQSMIALSKLDEPADSSDALSRENGVLEEEDPERSRHGHNVWDDGALDEDERGGW